MLNTLLNCTVTDQTAEAHRHAYNAAFEKLGLSWHWDEATYARLRAQGRYGVRTYLETEQPHLLRAYDADFLVDAIETTQSRCFASIAGSRARPTPYVRWAGDSPTHPGGMNASTATRHGAPAHRLTPAALT